MKYFPFFLIFLLAGSCTGPARETAPQVLEPTFDPDSLTEFAARQYAKTLETLPDTNRIPRNAHPDGTWNLVKKGSWVSGFYPGVLWHLYALTGDEQWKTAGEAALLKLDSVQFFDYDHDIGFRIFNSFGSALRFTKDSSYVPVIVDAAKTLKTRYRPVTGVIRSWDWHDQWQYPVIIDNMMNLELLFWAARQTGDEEMRKIAISHAEHTMEHHFRDDYSTYHVLDYDTLSGAVREKVTFQGYADSSMWARGQVWAIYGFTMTARETGRENFLKQAKGAADIFLKRLPEDGVPYWDFDAPGIPDEPKDASAAAIAASALLELSQLVDSPKDQIRYRHAAVSMLNALATPKYLAALPQQGIRNTSNPLPPDPNGFMREDFREPEFIRQHTTAYLSWIAAEIEKYDSGRHLHVNSHMLFVTLPEYEFPAWRKLLSSFGASMHPSWHFGYFDRDQYPVAMGANNDIIRAGAGEKPFWVTELQGGNNSYSGFNPMTPSAEEIEQWLWGSLFSGAEGIIFWCLNPRKAGLEAGEWSLLDFLDEPTDRMETAGGIADWLKNHPDFAKARPQMANVHVLYNRESMYLQRDREVRSVEVEQYFEGRLPGATIKSVLAHYEALLEQGITPELGSMDDFDWEAKGRAGAAVIIPHQIVMPRRHWEGLKTFVAEGGQLLFTGLSAHFDEYGQNIMTGGFPFREVLGGQVREFRVMGNAFSMSVNEKKFPAHLWQGTLAVDEGAVLSYAQDSLPVALQHQYGQGRTFWIPAPIGLAAWQQDNTPLAQLLQAWLEKGESPQVRFRSHHPGITMKTMMGETGLYTLLINKNDSRREVVLDFAKLRSGQILYDSAGAECQENRVLLPPDACVVLFWEKLN